MGAVVIVLAAIALASLGVAIATRDAVSREVVAPGRGSPSADASVSAELVDAGAGEEASAVALDAGPYALDELPRAAALAEEGCPDVPLVDHAGDDVAWDPALRVHPAFVPSVRALERAIVDTAREVYGRAPERVLSASSFRCTTIRRRDDRVSEHALGNAIDVRGVVIDGEEITVRERWTEAEEESPHARFFHALVRRVLRDGVFRGVIGPPARDHHDHLHFDHGPSRFVDLELPRAP